jgi:membrane associated rhomboid family serine protease
LPDEPFTEAEIMQARQFQHGMWSTTPKAFVTPLLIGINLAVFVAMAINGLSIVNPTIDGLIRWGADFGPLTTHGQWWRILSSAFVHIGIIHIAMNMYILFSIGNFVERLFGNLGFAVLYLLAGIGGSLVSVAWNPFTVAAGASGAIFGLYGGLLGFLLVQRNTIPGRAVASLTKNAAIFVGFNLLYGAAKTHVDMAAHLGGIATGFLVGCALAQPFSATRTSRMVRSLTVLVFGLAISAGCATKIPVVDDLDAELKRMAVVESSSLKLFNDSIGKLQAGRLNPAEFDNIVQTQLLPPWNGALQSLRKLRVSGEQKELVTRLTNYMSLRAEAWSLAAQGVREQDANLIQQANLKQEAAAAGLEQMNKPR